MDRATLRRRLPVVVLLVVLVGGGPVARPAQAAPTPAPAANGVTMRELTFANGDVALAGTLHLPPGAGPFPAVVIMHGSGPDSRVPYIPDAQMLADAGIAAFIFDKRGTGQSGGDWRRASLDDLMADGLAAVTLVQSQPEIDLAKVGLLGSSQGAWLAPFMAARDSRVAFFVQVTGSATPLANQELWGTGNALKSLGFSDRAIRTAMKTTHLLYSARGLIRAGILPLGDLWFVTYDPTLDPAAAWANIRVPALVLYGAADPTVPSETSLHIVREALAQGGHPDSRVVVFPDLGHALGGPARNTDPAYTSVVTGWIKAVMDGAALPAMPYPDTTPPTTSPRWYGLGPDPTPWYATAALHLPLILLFLGVFVGAAIISLLPRVRFGGALPRVLLGLTGAANAFVLVGLVLALNYLLNADAEQSSPEVPLSGALFPLAWAGVALVAGLTYAWATTRRRGERGLGHVVLAIVTVAGWAFVLFAGYWGLLGGRL